MPKYTFICKNCGQEFNVKVAWEEKESALCPNCGSQDKVQQFKPVGIVTGSSSCPTAAEGAACPMSGSG